MKPIPQALKGLAAALISGGIVLGGIALAMAEGGLTAPPAPTAEPTAAQPGLQPTALPAAGERTPTHAAVITATFPPPPACPPPSGWLAYTVQGGDTLPDLAVRSGATAEAIAAANCLVSAGLLPGTILYLPPAASPTPAPQTAVPCGPPRGWIRYTVQPQDNLFRIGRAYGVSVAELQWANCLGGSTLIQAGQRIYVPNVPTRTPTPGKPEPTQPPAATATDLPTREAPTATATATATFTATASPTPTASSTPTPTATSVPPTATNTDTPTPISPTTGP